MTASAFFFASLHISYIRSMKINVTIPASTSNLVPASTRWIGPDPLQRNVAVAVGKAG